MPRYRADIDDIPSYVPGRPLDEVSRELGISDIVKLASNEYPAPPFPEVQAVIAAAAAEVHRYPEDSGYYLTKALAAHLGVPADHIWLGAGSTQLIGSIGSAMGGRGTSTVFAWPSFVGYRIAAAMAGTPAIEVPLDSTATHDLAAIRTAITQDTTLVFVCNPNNPTGTMVGNDELTAFIRSVPEDVLVVIDEAYHEFATSPGYATQIPASLARSNVVVLRTFSKVYGLAGLRVGYAVTRPEVITALRHTQLPFVVNSIGQQAALASLDYQDRLATRVEENSAGRDYLEAALTERGLSHYESQTNFVAFTPPNDPTAFSQAMMRRGVIVRPLGKLVRVTVGLPQENERFVAVLDLLLLSPDEPANPDEVAAQ